MLTTDEIKLLKRVFRTARLPRLDQVTIADGVNANGGAWTDSDYEINVGPSFFRQDLSSSDLLAPTLVHEMTHVWQYYNHTLTKAHGFVAHLHAGATDWVQKTLDRVMVSVGEPVEVKLVDSLAHHGGNVTGLSLIAPQLAAKRLDLLKQALPKLSRVTVLWNSANQGMKARYQETQLGAQSVGVALQSVTVQSPDDFEPLFVAMSRDRPESLLVLADTVTVANRQRTVEFAARNRVPAIYGARTFVDRGGLMSYGVDFADHYRRTAIYVDKVLKGAKPADLPVELPTKFEFVINLKTAKALGLTIPQSLLQRADQVIE